MPNRTLPIVTRRELLAWSASGAASALAVGCSTGEGPIALPKLQPTSAPAYFSTEERALLGALADAVIPPDDVPGGQALGAVEYIEKLLTAFSEETPFIYPGGPYSDRHPMPVASGARPAAVVNDWTDFLPLDRVAERAWKLRIYGSSGVPGGGPNDATLGPVIGLRETVATAIAGAKAAMPPNTTPLELDAGDRKTMLARLDSTSQSVIVELVLEGCFTAPEYGGNARLAGWAMCHFEGDSMPYGYSTYDTKAGRYLEHPEHPCSTPNPGPDPMPMDAATEKVLRDTFLLLGGKVFR